MADILILSYHVITSKRKSGFLKMIDFLAKEGHEVDVLTIPVEINWLLKNTDRENAGNLFRLVFGITEKRGKGCVRNFSWPKIIPYRYSKKITSNYLIPFKPGCLLRLGNKYDYVIFESTPAVLFFEELKGRYPDAKFIYRPSDPIAAYSEENILLEGEKRIIKKCDSLWLVNESSKIFYEKYYSMDLKHALVLHNPLVRIKDVALLKNRIIKNINKKEINLVYLGVFPIDYSVIKEIINKCDNVKVHIIGPHACKSANSRVIYYGALRETEWAKLLENMDVGLVPIRNKGHINQLLEITGKIADYMLRLMPIIAINVAPMIEQNGIIVCNTTEDMIEQIKKIDIMSMESKRGVYLSTLLNYSDYKFESMIKKFIE